MDVYHNPDNIFVAGFIGSPRMNFLDAEVLGRPGCTLGARPEHIAVSRTSGMVPGRVDHVETLGSETNVVVGSDRLGVIMVRLFGHQEFAPGEAVFLDFDRDRALYFDATGQRLR